MVYKWLNMCLSIWAQYRTLAQRLECSPMARETWVQSQVESYQKLKKWYLMPPCLTLSIIRYGSRVKWSNPGKGVVPSPTPWCSKLSKREPSGHPRLWSPTLLTYYGLESKIQSMELKQSDSQIKEKFRAQYSVKMNMLIVLLDIKGLITTDFYEQGIRVNSYCLYCESF